MTDPAQLAIVARIAPKPEHRDAARDALLAILAPTRAEPGCEQFDLHEGEDASLYLVERWRSAAALTAHYEQPYVTRVFAAYEDWLAEPVTVTRLHPLG
ncbi:MAG: putative quinol monooxygenase [Pseudomonadota bacterium]